MLSECHIVISRQAAAVNVTSRKNFILKLLLYLEYAGDVILGKVTIKNDHFVSLFSYVYYRDGDAWLRRNCFLEKCNNDEYLWTVGWDEKSAWVTRELSKCFEATPLQGHLNRYNCLFNNRWVSETMYRTATRVSSAESNERLNSLPQ